MNTLQLRYNLLHIFYFFSVCSINGFTAVFLQHKGMSNTLVGLAMGIGCLLSIVVSPLFSSILERMKGMTIKKLILYVYTGTFFAYAAMAFLPMPAVVLLPLYMIMMSSVLAVTPLLSMICMNYAADGHDIDFGTARGMGSMSYAVGAVLLGQISKTWNPDLLAAAFILSGAFMLAVFFVMPDCRHCGGESLREESDDVNCNTAKAGVQTDSASSADAVCSMESDAAHSVKAEEKEESTSIFHVIKTYRTFFLILLGYGIVYSGVSALGTYLVNIVTDLGGDTSLYGIALFCMAASEMPIMAATGKLIKKYGCERLIMVASIFYIFRNFTICLAPNIPVLLAGMMCQGASYGLFTAVITNYVGSHLAAKHGLAGQNLIAIMSTGLGTTLGSILGGFLIDHFGFTGLNLYAMGATVIGVSIMFAACLAVLVHAHKEKKASGYRVRKHIVRRAA